MTDALEGGLFAQGLRQATESNTGPGLDAAIAALGWHDALLADPRLAVSALFEAQGAVCTSSGALDDLLASALGLGEAPGCSVVLPPLDDWDPPGDFEAGRISAQGLGTARLADADCVTIVATTTGGTTAVTVKGADLLRRSVQGLDPRLGLVEVTCAGSACSQERRLAAGAWPEALGLTQLALGYELVGAAQAMLDLARVHAVDRVQFGRAISSFQAVRHRLADTLVAIEAARALLAEAWEDRSPRATALAKAMAGQAARTTARNCQQVLAGVGFTTEHPFHRYMRRVLVLDDLLGSSRSLTRSLGRELIDSREVPRPLPL